MTLADVVKHALAAAGMSLALWSAAPAEPATAQDMTARPGEVIWDVDPTARLAVLGTNVILNGAICGIVGAAENRDGWRDMAQCMLGAAVQYAGMDIGMYDVPALPGLALRIVETGTSIIDNTLTGREMFERLHYEFGPALIEIDTRRGDINGYLRAYPIAGIIYNIGEGHEFNALETLSTQILTFTNNDPETPGIPHGMTTGNIVWFDRDVGAGLHAHERTHVFQYVRFRPLQNAIPDGLSFFEETLHLRLGEDLLFLLINLPQTICQATDSEYCGRQPYNLGELEAYTMQTAASP